MNMLEELLSRYPLLQAIQKELTAAEELLTACFRHGGKLLLCGNGGSCADCDHIVGELMKGFRKRRPLSSARRQEMKARVPALMDAELDRLQEALPAVALPSVTALSSAYANDVDARLVYAQAVMGLGTEKDTLLALSTSGNSENVVLAAQVAKALDLRVLALTGGQRRSAEGSGGCVYLRSGNRNI